MRAGIYVVMGVSGSGKSLIGDGLAHALGVQHVEGDAYHPPANLLRMAAGIPLTDADRQGWLTALADRIAEAKRAGVGLVVSCSALRRRYRDVLRAGASDIRFIYLKGSRELIAARLAVRRGHFMPLSLLDSQLATLEEPWPDERAWVYDIAPAPESIVADIVARVNLNTYSEHARARHVS
jgi:gluconokinase